MTEPLPSRITDAELAHLPLDGALDDLRERVLAAAAEEDATRPAGRFRWPLVAAAVAAAVALALAVPAFLADRDQGPGRGDGPVGVPTGGEEPLDLGFPDGYPGSEPWEPPSTLAELDAPGWTLEVDSVQTTTASLSIRYTRGPRALVLSWDESERYAEYTSGGGRTSPFEVLGMEGRYADGFDGPSVLTPPVDGYLLLITGVRVDREEFRTLVDQLRRVPTLSLPPEIIDPTEVRSVAADVYAGAELPDGFVPLPTVGWHTEEGLVDQIVFDIKCGWAQTYYDGDAAVREEALTTLRRSSRWPLVQAVPRAGELLDDIIYLAGSVDEYTVLSSCPGAIPD